MEVTEIIRKVDREATINTVKAEVQCMEVCLAQGFDFKDYIQTQKDLIETLTSLN